MASDQLEVRFDFKHKMLMIRFRKEKHAKDYMKKNTESRSLPDGGRHDVYLPILPTMRYIRACSEEFAISFTSPEAAKTWSDGSILGHQRVHNKLEVSIKRNRTEDELDKLLALEGPVAPDTSTRLNLARTNIKDERPASRPGPFSISPKKIS